MKQVFYLFIAAFIITVASCKQDKCEGVVCKNGGTCQDGTCACNEAWTGPTCEIHTNACDTLRCHWGYCATGHCNCDWHVSGDSCTILDTPSVMYITGATVDHFSPAVLGGNTWDYDEVGVEQGTRPDIYTVIKKNGITIYCGRQHNLNYNYFPDAQYDSQHRFIYHEDSIKITGQDVYDSIFRFELYDYDFGSGIDDSDYMGGFNFRPFTSRDGFPGGVSYHDTTFYYDEFEYRLNYSPYYEW